MAKKMYFRVSIILTCCAQPVLAQTIPHYEVEKYCREVATYSGGSSMIFNGCMDMEQNAYDTLKPVWNHVPASSRNYCDEVARASGGSYGILKGCVDMEVEAENSKRSFEY